MKGHLVLLSILVVLMGSSLYRHVGAQDAGHQDHQPQMPASETNAMSSHDGHGHQDETPETGHDMHGDDHAGHDPMAHGGLDQEAQEIIDRVKVVEHLGEKIPLDLKFTDENGKEVILGDLFDKPVVILPIYFFCPTICSFLLADLADVINTVDQVPGEDFNVVALSFSDDETHQDAREAKKNYVKLITRDFDPEKWIFLTGEVQSIRKLTDSLGFHFVKKKKHLYVHPNVLMVLSDQGMVTRYVYGPDFLPFDVGMALMEAQKGQTGISIKKGVMSFCFEYDPDKKTYVFNIFRISGTLILFCVLCLVFFLIFSPSRRNKKQPS